MTEQRQPPSIEKVKERSVKIQEICKRADANILILDYIIAQLEEGIRQQPLNRYRLEKAKRLLNIAPGQLEKAAVHQQSEA
jgi:hypothetical protein